MTLKWFVPLGGPKLGGAEADRSPNRLGHQEKMGIPHLLHEVLQKWHDICNLGSRQMILYWEVVFGHRMQWLRICWPGLIYHARKSSNGLMNSIQRMKLDLHLTMLCKDPTGKLHWTSYSNFMNNFQRMKQHLHLRMQKMTKKWTICLMVKTVKPVIKAWF